MNILIIEDNQKIADNIAVVLEHEKYQVTVVYTGQDGLKHAEMEYYDLIILDLMLPDMQGVEVCKKIRSLDYSALILMLTAKIDLDSKVEGLDSGADDYLTKPFLMDELIARIRALLRRKSTLAQAKIQLSDDVEIDLKAKRARKGENFINFSSIEWRIIQYLLNHLNQIKSPFEIMQSVWGNEEDDVMFSDRLKVHIARLRKKLGRNAIKTVFGSGYMIEVKDQ